MRLITRAYPTGAFFDELIDDEGHPRPAARALFEHLDALDAPAWRSAGKRSTRRS